MAAVAVATAAAAAAAGRAEYWFSARRRVASGDGCQLLDAAFLGRRPTKRRRPKGGRRRARLRSRARRQWRPRAQVAHAAPRSPLLSANAVGGAAGRGRAAAQTSRRARESCRRYAQNLPPRGNGVLLSAVAARPSRFASGATRLSSSRFSSPTADCRRTRRSLSFRFYSFNGAAGLCRLSSVAFHSRVPVNKNAASTA